MRCPPLWSVYPSALADIAALSAPLTCAVCLMASHGWPSVKPAQHTGVSPPHTHSPPCSVLPPCSRSSRRRSPRWSASPTRTSHSPPPPSWRGLWPPWPRPPSPTSSARSSTSHPSIPTGGQRRQGPRRCGSVGCWATAAWMEGSLTPRVTASQRPPKGCLERCGCRTRGEHRNGWLLVRSVGCVSSARACLLLRARPWPVCLCR